MSIRRALSSATFAIAMHIIARFSPIDVAEETVRGTTKTIDPKGFLDGIIEKAFGKPANPARRNARRRVFWTDREQPAGRAPSEV